MIAHYDDFHKLHFHLLVIAHRRPEVVILSKMQLSLNLDLPFAELLQWVGHMLTYHYLSIFTPRPLSINSPLFDQGPV